MTIKELKQIITFLKDTSYFKNEWYFKKFMDANIDDFDISSSQGRLRIYLDDIKLFTYDRTGFEDDRLHRSPAIIIHKMDTRTISTDTISVNAINQFIF